MEKQETSVKSLQYLLDAKVAQVNFDKYQAEVTELQEKFRKFEQHVIAQDAYNKRQNILIHGYEEKDDCVWETRNKTLGKFYEFLNNGLNLRITWILIYWIGIDYRNIHFLEMEQE